MYAGVAVLLLAAIANGQAIYTETWDLMNKDGQELAVSTGTDARGIIVTRTLSTIRGAGGVAPTAAVTTDDDEITTTPRVPPVRTTATTAATATTTTRAVPTVVQPTPDEEAPAVAETYTTYRGVQGNTALPPPQRTMTYKVPNPWCDPGTDPLCSEVVWTATGITAPTVATAIVPQGSPMEYSEYQAVVNSRVFGDAVEKQGQASAQAGNVNGQPNAAVGKARVVVGSLLLGMGLAIGVMGRRF